MRQGEGGRPGGGPAAPDDASASGSRAAPVLLVAAQSARGLVAAAGQAGFAALAVDLFGDDDTVALAAGSRRVRGLAAPGVTRAFEAMLAGREGEVAGLVLGSGFEHRPGVVAALSERFGLLGNPAEVVARAKDPFAFAALCRTAGVPHPQVRRAGQGSPGPASHAPLSGRSASGGLAFGGLASSGAVSGGPASGGSVPGSGAGDAAGWLLKRRGASGGAHVRLASGDVDAASSGAHAGATGGGGSQDGWYAQRRVPGRAVSACFVADGRRAVVLGFSAQWSEPAAGAEFRYGGAVRPAGARFEAEMAEAVSRLTRALGLIGLNSADFLVGKEEFHVIEINPRPGASLDVFADALPLRLHVEACRDRMPDAAPVLRGARAAAVAYAGHDGVLARGFAWPGWAADRQRAGRVRAGAPFCTALADAARPARARGLARARAAAMLGRAGLSAQRQGTIRAEGAQAA